MLGLFVENGPCFVNPDSNSTYLSDWSWNNEVNMLYLDQPVQVGLSYDGLRNVTLDLLEGDVTLRKFVVSQCSVVWYSTSSVRRGRRTTAV